MENFKPSLNLDCVTEVTFCLLKEFLRKQIRHEINKVLEDIKNNPEWLKNQVDNFSLVLKDASLSVVTEKNKGE